MPGISGETLRAWRRSRGWDVPKTAQRLRQAAGDTPMPVHDALVRMIYRWERGEHALSERYELLYRAIGLGDGQRSGQPGDAAAADHSVLARARLDTLSADQLDELIRLLDDQWHVLVRTDNLLGPRHALGGVSDQIGVIEALLRSVRLPLRLQVLQLGAKYAESAAWLHEDSGDMAGSRYWTGRSMEWALEAGDRRMMSWALYRARRARRSRRRRCWSRRPGRSRAP